MLNRAAAVKGFVPIGYDGAINLMAAQEKKPQYINDYLLLPLQKKLTELYAAPLPKCYRPINQ